MRRIVAALQRGVSFVWDDRRRVLLAGFAAIVLWFLIGGKVERDKPLRLDVAVVPAGRAPVNAALNIMMPDELALVSVEPKQVSVKVRSTDENLNRIDSGSLLGQLEIPKNYCDNERRTTVETVDVLNRFEFEEVPGVVLESVDPPTLVLEVAQRNTGRVYLDASNLTFEPPTLADGLDVRFEPNSFDISGPYSTVDRVTENHGLLQITAPLGASDVLKLKENPRSFPAGAVFLLDRGQVKRGLVRVEGTEWITVSLSERAQLREQTFSDVPVEAYVPERARRPGQTVVLDPKTVTVRFQVTEKFALEGRQPAELLQSLQLFVNVGTLQRDAGLLPVVALGIDEEVVKEVEIVPSEIDVTWKDGASEGGE
jgi:hypothetical protein